MLFKDISSMLKSNDSNQCPESTTIYMINYRIDLSEDGNDENKRYEITSKYKQGASTPLHGDIK
jgi:hypothetical protein